MNLPGLPLLLAAVVAAPARADEGKDESGKGKRRFTLRTPTYCCSAPPSS
jgi:hypothetical protein